MVVTITLLNDFGKPIPGYTRCLVNMVFVMDYIYKHNGTSNCFVFSKLEEESVGGTFCSISNMHQHMIQSPNYLAIKNSQPALSIKDSTRSNETCEKKRRLPTLPPMDFDMIKDITH